MMRVVGRSRARMGAAAVLAVVQLLGGCGGGPGSVRDPPEQPGADAYATVIGRFLPTAIDSDARPVVYVVPVNGETLALPDQVAVIDALSEVGDVRFVDDVDAAVDEESSDQPPRDEGMLVGLGRFSSEPPYTIRVELYRGLDRVDGWMLTVRNDGGRWVVIDAEPVEPEVLGEVGRS